MTTDLELVIIDATVQPEAIAHPVDSQLPEIARHEVLGAAKRRRHQHEADLRPGGHDPAAQGRRLRERQAVQSAAQVAAVLPVICLR